MPKYVVFASHDPSGCPGASAQMGEVFMKLMAKGPAIAAKYQVQVCRLADVQDVQLSFGEELRGLIEKTERLGLQPLY